MSTGVVSGLRRKSFSPWVTYPSLVLLYGFLVPVTKFLEKTGLWGRLASRRPRDFNGKFGDYQATFHDVFACVYFKSGTNWLMQILVEIVHHGAAKFEHVHDIVPWPDSPDPRYAVPLSDQATWKKSPEGLRVIKTHRLLADIPFSPEARYVCVVRDPKDVCVSAYHFIRASVMGPMTPAVPMFVEYFLSPAFSFYPWAAFLDGYWRIRNCENVLFMTYEEMKADLRGTVRKIAGFLKVELSEAEMDAVVRHASFDHMKEIEHKFETGMLVPWATPHGAMVRRGQRGGSAELLTPALQQKIDDHFRAELKGLGCDFPYDEAFAPGVAALTKAIDPHR
jgi:Sulfotransferase domain